MVLVFQFTLLALILLSFVMIVSVPLIFASENNWVDKKDYVLFGATAWLFLVILVGILNSFVI